MSCRVIELSSCRAVGRQAHVAAASDHVISIARHSHLPRSTQGCRTGAQNDARPLSSGSVSLAHTINDIQPPNGAQHAARRSSNERTGHPAARPPTPADVGWRRDSVDLDAGVPESRTFSGSWCARCSARATGFTTLELRDGQFGPSCPRLPRAVAPSHRSSGCGQVRLRSAVASVLAAFEMPLWRRPTRLVPIHPDIVDNDVDIV